MRKHIVKIVVCLLSMASFAQTEKTKASQTTFGRYGANCSSGRGACSFTVSTEAKSARHSKKLSDNSITLEINTSQLTEEEQIRIAGKVFSKIKPGEKPEFIQQESLTVDKPSLKNLEINSAFNTIQPGKYPMQITKDKVTIIFTLSSG